MKSEKSLLRTDIVKIAPGITLRMPAVGEVLDNEISYYSVVSSLTAVPFQYMVQLDNMGIDYTTIDDWELFCIFFTEYSRQDIFYRTQLKKLRESINSYSKESLEFAKCLESINLLSHAIENNGFDIVFKDFKLSEEYKGNMFGFSRYKLDDGEIVLYNPATQVTINKLIHKDLTDTIRKINLFEKVKFKPGNESAKKYLLEKERKKQKRAAKKPYKSQLEKLVIALVNTSEFPYDYDSCMDLSIYKFNQSFKQIQHKIAFDNTMVGVYAGTINTSKMGNKDILSWISNK